MDRVDGLKMTKINYERRLADLKLHFAKDDFVQRSRKKELEKLIKAYGQLIENAEARIEI